MSQYSDPGVSRIEMQDYPVGSGKTNISIQFRNGHTGGYTNSDSYSPFLDPADADRWMHCVYQLVGSTTVTSTDGIIRLYRRWEDESNYELINELVDLPVPVTEDGDPGWRAGYLMGWANAPFTVQTEFLIDDFVMSTTSLLTETVNAGSGVNAGENIGENVGEQ